MILSYVISTVLESGRRMIKALVRGDADVRETNEVAPYGLDSNPVADLVAVYSDTEVKGDMVIIGYINVNQLAEVGELRLYATDADGVEKTRVWLRNDGKIEIGKTGARGSATNHMTQYEGLQTAFNQLKTDFAALVTKHNAWLTEYKTHVHSGVTTGPGSSGPTISVQTNASNSTADITGAKLDNILTE